MKRKIQPVETRTENGILINVYAEKKTKRIKWMKNDTFYAAAMRITDDSSFASFSRKPGKA